MRAGLFASTFTCVTFNRTFFASVVGVGDDGLDVAVGVGGGVSVGETVGGLGVFVAVADSDVAVDAAATVLAVVKKLSLLWAESPPVVACRAK